MSGAQQRQVSRRVFASEFNDSTHFFKESDDDMAPNFALLPTGVRANRVFFAGTVTETNDVGSDQEYWQARIVDPTDTFFVYAGQYQPDSAAFLRQVEPPAYVSVVGKPRSYETDDGNINVTVRPEYIKEVEQVVRDNWLEETALQTLDRIEEMETTDLGSDMAPPDLLKADDVYDVAPTSYREDIEEAIDSMD